MKTRSPLSLNCGALALLALLPLATTASETTGTETEQSSEPCTHVLFTGTDFQVLFEEQLRPVRDVDGTSLVIRFTDKKKGLDIPLASHAKKLVVTRVQKLADRSATLANFKYERAYTPNNDPARQGIEDMIGAAKLAENARTAEERLRHEPKMKKVYRGGMTYTEEPNELYQKLEQQLQQAKAAADGNMASVTYQAERMAAEQAREPFDALEMQFEVSSDAPIQTAYMIVLADYHTTDRPKESQTWIAAKSLGAIDSNPRKVWLREGGLPQGYVLENVRVQLYEDGVEIATNQSENRAALTRAEAHEYLVIDYLSTHKTDTVPARLALAKLPEDWSGHPRDQSFNKPFFVQVDKSGRPIGVFSNESCTEKVSNSYYDSVLRDQLFFPALEEGNPVDSVVRVRLTKLST